MIFEKSQFNHAITDRFVFVTIEVTNPEKSLTGECPDRSTINTNGDLSDFKVLNRPSCTQVCDVREITEDTLGTHTYISLKDMMGHKKFDFID